jgi:hypothetical protein
VGRSPTNTPRAPSPCGPFGKEPNATPCAIVPLSNVAGTYRYQIGRLISAKLTSHNVSATVSSTNSGTHKTTSKTVSRRVAGSRSRSPIRARKPCMCTGRYGAGIGGLIRCRSTLAIARVTANPAASSGRPSHNQPRIAPVSSAVNASTNPATPSSSEQNRYHVAVHEAGRTAARAVPGTAAELYSRGASPSSQHDPTERTFRLVVCRCHADSDHGAG